MGIKSDLEGEVAAIYKAAWSKRDGRVVPQDTDVQLGNDGVKLEVTMLYADLADSTKLAHNYQEEFAAEQYKAFLRCAARIIRSESGEIRSYDGDRVMGIFVGDSKNTSAVRCALKINWAVKNIIEPAKKLQYPNTNYVMKHVVGVDTSTVLAARGGIRGANDLIWIGQSPNFAAKLAAMDESHATWISHRVYDNMHESVKYLGSANMWAQTTWPAWDNMRIHMSTYWWSLN
ncbi:hypothetical protein N185_35280 [Sinorhizobium sp. GW3]|nr:hypothetical protein N185_35280 [Sinorhizobium sp. GW3]